MNIKEILESYKSRTLICENEKINLIDFGDRYDNILDDMGYIRSLDMRDLIFKLHSSGKIEYRYAKSDFMDLLKETFEKKDAWNKFDLEGEYTKEDFEYKSLRECKKQEKTERLLFLIRNYRKIIENEKLQMLSFSANELDKGNFEDEIEQNQRIQARYEIYKYLLSDSEDEIPQIYKKFKECGDEHILLDMLKNKDFEKFLTKKNDYYKGTYENIKQKLSSYEIEKLLNFFKKIKKDFKMPFESLITDFQTYINYESEMKKIDELEQEYVNVKEDEIQEEISKAKREEEKRLEEERKRKELKRKEEEKRRLREESKTKSSGTQDTVFPRISNFDIDEGNLDEFIEFYEKNPVSNEQKENIRILFIHWVSNDEKDFEEVFDETKRKFLFEKIKEIANSSDKKLGIFVCTSKNEESSRKLIDSFDENLKKSGISNAFVAGVTGQHGRFLIDREKRKFRMYELPDKIREKIIKKYKEACNDGMLDECLDENNKHTIIFSPGYSMKNGERLKDYIRAFNGYFRMFESLFKSYELEGKHMLILTKNQYQQKIKEKLITYSRLRYNVDEKDIIDSLSTKIVPKSTDDNSQNR